VDVVLGDFIKLAPVCLWGRRKQRCSRVPIRFTFISKLLWAEYLWIIHGAKRFRRLGQGVLENKLNAFCKDNGYHHSSLAQGKKVALNRMRPLTREVNSPWADLPQDFRRVGLSPYQVSPLLTTEACGCTELA